MNTRSGSSMSARSVNANANSYTTARQTPRLQNTQKTTLGTGWGSVPGPTSTVSMASPFGGLGTAARPGQLSGFAQVMGGGSAHGPIDMSDFPSLSGRVRPQQGIGQSSAGWNSSAIRQPSNQAPSTSAQLQQRTPSVPPQQQSSDPYDPQRQRRSSGERAEGHEDFPPLGAIMSNNGLGQSNDFSSELDSPEIQPRQAIGQPAQLPIRQNSLAQHQVPASSLPQLQSSTNNTSQNSTQASLVKKYTDMTESEKWGLPGLLAALELRKQAESGGPIDETLPAIMRSPVFMGQDLNDLGMNLDSQEPIYSTFTPFPVTGSSGSAFDFHDRHVVPDFTLPSAYTVTNVPPLGNRMAAFSDETLFSIFYLSPRDIAQELAANELTAREWRWHKVLRQWLQKDTRESNMRSSLPLVDLAGGAPIGTQPVRVGERSERGVYVFFDAPNWRRERREFVLDYEQLEHHRNVVGPALPGTASTAPTIGVAPGMPNGMLGASQQQQQSVM